jgi:hypothetical protein
MTQQLPSFLRHQDYVSQEHLNYTVNIIGCGATGSNLAMILARMGYKKFRLWDADVVEDHNLPNQAYFAKHIGMPKAEALSELITEFNPTAKIEFYTEFFTEDDAEKLDDIVVMALDNMYGRRMLGEIIKGNIDILYAIETRIGFDFAELNILDPLNVEHCNEWLNALKSDDEVEQGPCGMRICATTVHTVTAAACHFMCRHAYTIAKREQWIPPKKVYFDLTGGTYKTHIIEHN